MSETVIINPADTHAKLMDALQRLADAENKIAALQMRVRILDQDLENIDAGLCAVEYRLGISK